MSENAFIPKAILVTGAAGFIGSNFVRMMLMRYPELNIVSLDKLTYAGRLANLENLENPENHTFVEGDILDQELVFNLLKQHQINSIVHFAAESHVDNSIAGPQVFFQTNVIGTVSLLEAARHYWLNEMKYDENNCRFHHVSTDEVYGTLSLSDPAFTEETPYSPSSPYSASKAGSDHAVRSYFHTYGLPVTISNCSNNYGPYQHSEKLIPVVIKSCIHAKPIPIYGDGSNIRDWLYVEDHCDAIACILTEGVTGQTYNIGGDNEIDNLTLVKNICQLMDEIQPKGEPYEKLITFVEDRQGHDWRYAIDNTKICSELNWQPKQKFKELFAKTIRFYLKND